MSAAPLATPATSASVASVATATTAATLIPPRQRAFTLHCKGLHAPAIAEQLGVPERTVRAWDRAALDDMARDFSDQRQRQLALAIARQETILAAAWQGYARAAQCETLVLEQTQRQQRDVDIAAEVLASARAAAAEGIPASGDSERSEDNPLADAVETRIAERLARAVPEPPRLPMAGSRYLAMAHAAQKEIARLQGLYQFVPPPAKPSVVRVMTEYQKYESLPEPERSAWLLFLAHYLEVLHPDLISRRSRPDEAVAAEEALDAAIAAAGEASLSMDTGTLDGPASVAAASPAHEGGQEGKDHSREGAATEPQKSAESADAEFAISAESAMPNAPAPSSAALAEACRRMVEVDAAAEAATTEPQILLNRRERRDTMSPSITRHPDPDGVLRSLLDRFHAGILPPPRIPPIRDN